jgi:hydrogenase expression/formation protein HypE
MEGVTCPAPLTERDAILLGHGSGGQLAHRLITGLFLPVFDNDALRQGNDAAIVAVEAGGGGLAVCTDSHVVAPLFFPGGDIGRLAVCGTVNDLAMLGAQPLALTAGFILEEGLPMPTLERVVRSMQAAAAEAGVAIVAGDTKVVERGKADGLYVNTAGIGRIGRAPAPSGDRARPGDVVIVSGTLGDHGIAVISARGELGLETSVSSDVCPLNHLVADLLAAHSAVHVLRDPTRGGVATTLNEIAQQSQVGIVLDEARLPVRPAVAAACEVLGFDPLYLANEGKLIAMVGAAEAESALETLRRTRYGAEAAVIGTVQAAPAGYVMARTPLGTHRLVSMLAGELLPRIC